MDDNTNIAKNTILESLNLTPSSAKNAANEEKNILCCMFCDHTEESDFRTENKPILQHMYMEHRLVIADVKDVLSLCEYLKFWRSQFKG